VAEAELPPAYRDLRTFLDELRDELDDALKHKEWFGDLNPEFESAWPDVRRRFEEVQRGLTPLRRARPT
jgi:hypothetical protein